MNRTEFFKKLYQNSEGSIELRALPSRHRVFIPLDSDPSAVDRFCKQNSDDHLYFGVATRDGAGGEKANIVDIPALWADVDYKDTPKETLKDRMSKFPFRPSMAVFSGGGVHLYWILREPAGKDDIETVEDVNRRIASVIGGDLNACDAARILRIPGTVNHKYPEKPECRVIHDADFTYALEDFTEALPEAPQARTSSSKNGAGDAAKPLLECEFIKHCKENPTEISEPLWFALISNLICVRPNGYSLCHELSKGYPGYSRQETDEKIQHALDGPGPHTCEFISANGFECSKTCNVKSPAGLLFNIEGFWDKSENQQKRVTNTEYASIKAVSGRLSERIDENASAEKIGQETGFRFIDETIFGLVPGFMYVIGGYTSVGKSALMNQLIINCIKRNPGIKIAVYSTEMSDQQMLLRLLASLTAIPSLKIFSGRLKPDEAQKVANSLEYLNNQNIFLYDSIYDFQGIYDHSMIIGPDVVFVDYLQNMQADGTIFERMSRIPVQLHDMAKKLNTAVVAMSQISNEAAKGDSKTIGYKGAGEVAAACDFGIWLERNKDNDMIIDCYVRKNRHGPKCSTSLKYSNNFTRLYEN